MRSGDREEDREVSGRGGGRREEEGRVGTDREQSQSSSTERLLPTFAVTNLTMGMAETTNLGIW